MPERPTLPPRQSMPSSDVGSADASSADARAADALLACLRAGEESALEGLYDLLADRLYGLALWRCGSETEAADAVQDTFVRLATAARDGKLAGVKNARGYILTMVRRAAIDQVRRRPAHASIEALPEGGRLLESEEDDRDVSVDAERVCRCLPRLPAGQREAVYLRCFDDLTFEEIGRVCSVPTFTAASRFRLGIRKLRKLLGVKS